MAGGTILSIDAGTTGITAMVVDEQTRIVGRAYSEFTQRYPNPGWVEHDPVEIWDTTIAVARAAVADAGAAGRAVAAIGITNQRETAVLWERATGRPVAPAIVWQCRRSTEICERWKSDGLQDELIARTGLVLDPYFSASKIVWYLENIPHVRRRAEAGELAFGTVDSWLVWNLTGGTHHLTEPTNASRTMLYNLQLAGWDEWILGSLHIPAELLPAVTSTTGPFGTTTALTGTEIPITGIAGDQQSALFGQACFTPGMVKNTYGTGSFVLMHTGRDVPRSGHGLLSTAAWDVGRGLEYALEGSIFVTGAAIQWLRDGLGILGSASEAGPLAESVPDADGSYLVPAFTGLGAPHWDPYARGAFVGITRGTTKAHLVRAAVEAMAFQTRDVVDAMSADAGVPVTEMRVDGGASVMDVLCQFQADLLGVVVRRPPNLETTALGAAYLAGIGSGLWTSLDELARSWRAAATFEPQRPKAHADEMYEGWKKAVDRTRGWAASVPSR